MWAGDGGNPLYVAELLRAVELDGRRLAELEPAELLVGGREGIALRVLARVRGLDPRALSLAQALAVLGDGCELRNAAAITGMEMADAIALAAGLGSSGGVGNRRSVRGLFIRLSTTRSRHRWQATSATRCIAPPPDCLTRMGPRRDRSRRIWSGVRPVGDGWVLDRLREAGGRRCAAGRRARGRPIRPRPRRNRPAGGAREVLREAARAEASAGRETACVRWRRRCASRTDPRERAAIALEVAEAYATLFRWVDAVDVIDRALAELDDADEELAARLEGELVVCAVS